MENPVHYRIKYQRLFRNVCLLSFKPLERSLLKVFMFQRSFVNFLTVWRRLKLKYVLNSIYIAANMSTSIKVCEFNSKHNFLMNLLNSNKTNVWNRKLNTFCHHQISYFKYFSNMILLAIDICILTEEIQVYVIIRIILC